MYRKSLTLAVLLCFNNLVIAETLTGILTDEDEAVTKATVTLIESGSNVIVSKTHSSNNGEYRFTVKPGTYKLRVSKDEYADKWIKDIVVKGSDVSVDIPMTLQVFVDSTVVPESDGCD